LTVASTAKLYPVDVARAHAEIRQTLEAYGFECVKISVYTCADEDMANLFQAISALKALD